jgi:putative ABC transport system substrate-binding protein
VRTSDLVAQGFAASLSLPGGNITGQVDMSPELSAKQLSLLKELIPSATQVAVLWNSANLGKKQDFSQIQVAAEVLSIQVRSFEVRSIGDIELAFVVLARERTGAALFLDDALTSNYRQRIVDLAAAIRTPSMHHTKEAVRLGALMSYGAAELALFRNSAAFIDKILKGAKPADLPIERPTKFELVINLKTAKTLGVDVPLPLLYRADEVIE